MNYEKLENLNYNELKQIARDIDIPLRRSKYELFLDIKKAFKEYESYKKTKIDKYEKIERLGVKSKDSVTYLVRTKTYQEFAMKTFRKNKSSDKLKKEVEYQNRAYEVNASPKVLDYDTISKFIVMEKLEKNLHDIVEEKSELSKNYQKQIISLYKKMDYIKIFHGDVNLKNFMIDKKDKLYIIDFGESKDITNKLCNKLGTLTPNLQLMSLGVALSLKNNNCSLSSYACFLKYIPEEQLIHFNLPKSKKII